MCPNREPFLVSVRSYTHGPVCEKGSRFKVSLLSNATEQARGALGLLLKRRSAGLIFSTRREGKKSPRSCEPPFLRSRWRTHPAAPRHSASVNWTQQRAGSRGCETPRGRHSPHFFLAAAVPHDAPPAAPAPSTADAAAAEDDPDPCCSVE